MSQDLLEHAIRRWGASAERGDRPATTLKESAELLRRLDDHGCAYGRVTQARLDALTRSFERLESKLNAILLAALGSLLSTLVGLYLRG